MKVTCLRWDSEDVEYTVREGPRHGRLTVVDSAGRVRQFTQDDIDNGRVFYEHTEQGQLVDSFHFDVSCGTARHQDLKFGLDVLTSTIPLEVTGNLTVPHGGSATLTSNLLRVTGQQFEVDVESAFLITSTS